jgi:murein DD-endopeptidase MepM/ murein hydrolase activator NlpD
MYAYGTQYGVQGHAGVDYSMNTGTKLYTPVGGTVIRSGGSGYYTDERFGNRAGTGELRIKLDNGDEIILGHMQSINVPVGARVSAGQMVGLSGTSNGGHLHLEYRQWAPGSTPSGYKAIDPRTALGGNFTTPATGGAATGAVKSSYFTLPGARPATGNTKNAFAVKA